MFLKGRASLRHSLQILALGTLLTAPAFTADPVPAAYLPLYNELDGLVRSMNTTVISQWNGVKHPVNFGGNLLSANTGRGPSLLNPYALYGILLEAERLRSLGAKVVNIGVGYPTLLPAYYSDPAQGQKYIDLYKTLVIELKKLGLKVCIESGPEPHLAYYRTLSFDQYVQGRAEVLRIIADQVKPDYLVMVGEPDVEETFSGHPVNNPSNAARIVQQALAGMAGARARGMLAGAGVGSWQSNGVAFLDSYTQAGLISSTCISSRLTGISLRRQSHSPIQPRHGARR